MTGSVCTKAYGAPRVDKPEILRYLGVPSNATEALSLVNECIDEALGALSYKVCYIQTDILREGDTLCIGNIKTSSTALKKNLDGCGRAVIFAATVGISLDRIIARYSAISPTKAVIFDAIGSERIEALCDAFCEDISHGHRELKPRFSPGYGDLPIEVQRELFTLLDCPRKIGLTLNESMLMSPSKSVTAIIGIK